MVIRRATPADASGIAKVHVETWRSAYSGLIAAQYLRSLSYEKGERQWESVLGGPDAGHVHVAEDEQGAIVGFASGGQLRETHAPCSCELYAIYVLPSFQRMGLGRALVRETARSLTGAGMKSMLTWTLAANPSRAFYESLGGIVVARKQMPIGGEYHEVVAFGWADLMVLTA